MQSKKKICEAEFSQTKARFISGFSPVSSSIQLSAAQMRLSIHTSHFCQTTFSDLMLSVTYVGQRKCFRRRVFGPRYEVTKDLILRKIIRRWSEEETLQQFVSQYVQVALGREWPSFFFFGGTKFTHAQYINIMYELDSTRQKFGVASLSDSEI